MKRIAEIMTRDFLRGLLRGDNAPPAPSCEFGQHFWLQAGEKCCHCGITIARNQLGREAEQQAKREKRP